MIIADTGFFYALMNRKDKYHEQAKIALLNLDEPLITTWCVITESCHLLLSRQGTQYQKKFLDSINQELVEIFHLEKEYLPRIAELMEQYSNLPMDLADASPVILAEHLGHGRILSTDQKDFGIYRWKKHYPFTNLLI